MPTEFETCYRAITSRDTRFDGQFFTAVTSTGIYCRPICPAQTPKPENVSFYPSAAAAQAAGFRACKRCRPEAAPDSPEWNIRSDLVGRALRLIADGAVDAERVDGLAHRLAVSPRHLHRELTAEVGAGPLALARMRRAQTARLLVDGTAMPLGEVAFAAGFTSIRQFNSSVREAFGCSPSELRRREQPDTISGAGEITLRLGYRPPLDVRGLLDFLAHIAIPGVEEVEGNRYRRTALVGGSATVLQVDFPEQSTFAVLRLHLDDPRELGRVVAGCRRLFDLDADPAAITDVLGVDPVLMDAVSARPGMRVPGTIDGWEMAVHAILGQQVTTAGARTLAGRLVRTLGEPLPEARGSLTHLFPSPQAVADADLTGIGLIRSRASALQHLARAVVANDIELDRGADWERTVQQLLGMPGIGPWTASYIAMRVLRNPDAFPAADLGLKRAFERLGGQPGMMAAQAEQWKPWRAYAAMYLWTSPFVTPPSGLERSMT